MDTFTIFLDVNDPRREKFFWIFQSFFSVLWIQQGITGLYQQPEWHSWLQVIGGGLLLTSIIAYQIIYRKYGRRKLQFNELGIEVKAKLLGDSQRIDWQEMEHIKFLLNGVEITRKLVPEHVVKIPFESYVVNQQAKKLFSDYANRNNISIL